MPSNQLIIKDCLSLGANKRQVLEALENYFKNGMDLVFEDSGIKISRDCEPQVLFENMVKMFLEVDSALYSENSKRGQKIAAEQGRLPGRKAGQKIGSYKLKCFKDEIIEKRRNGVSIGCLAKVYGVTDVTMRNFLKDVMESL